MDGVTEADEEQDVDDVFDVDTAGYGKKKWLEWRSWKEEA